MATSYTSLLGLALPVQGELAGTWGDTVNNSITALLDTAVAGTTTISTDSDVTLTTTTGAANQSRQAVLLCTGSRTAVRNITAPAQSKVYVVINNTTGGYGVKIRGSGPTTGITVASGKAIIVAWNGSDFVEIVSTSSTSATNLLGGAAGSLPYQSGVNSTTFLGIGSTNQVLVSNGTAPTWTPNLTGINQFSGNNVSGTSLTVHPSTYGKFSTFDAAVLSTSGGTFGVGRSVAGSGFSELGRMQFLDSSTPRSGIHSWEDASGSAAYITFNTRNSSNIYAERARISGAGNFGLNRTPTYLLDVNGTSRFSSTISVGDAVPASTGAGISFPATQSASSDANTLDDYKEGTWTPTVEGTITAGTATYSVQNGRYTKIGRMVQIECYMQWTAGTGTGDIRVAGLPFTSASSTTFPQLSVSADNLNITAGNYLASYVNNGSTTIAIIQQSSSGGSIVRSTVPYDSAAELLISGWYTV